MEEKKLVVLTSTQEALIVMVKEMFHSFAAENRRKENQLLGALRRIKENEFACCNCDKEITLQRFYDNPLTSTCSEKCEKELETTRSALIKKMNEGIAELMKLEDELKARLQNEGGVVMSNHPADQNAHTSTSISREINLKKLVEKLDQAIDLLDQGKYGICKECHEKIDPKRLRVVPCAQHCTECKTEIEKRYMVPNGMGGRVSLSRLDRAVQI